MAETAGPRLEMVSVAWNSRPETNRMKLELHRFKKSNDPDIERELFLGKDLGGTDTAAEEIREFRDERGAWAKRGDAVARRPRTSPPACTPTAGGGCGEPRGGLQSKQNTERRGREGPEGPGSCSDRGGTDGQQVAPGTRRVPGPRASPACTLCSSRPPLSL